MTDEGAVLVTAMASGDGEAFARFYDRHAPIAYGLVLRIVPERGDAADVLQEVFWECWRTARTYEARRGPVEAWVLALTRARALDRMRALRRRGATLVAARENANAASEGDPADIVGRLSDRGPLTRALHKLPDAQREAIELAYYGGLTQTEIAASLKQPLGTVKTRLRFGLERLRELAKAMP